MKAIEIASNTEQYYATVYREPEVNFEIVRRATVNRRSDSHTRTAKKLRDLGAEIDSLSLKDICPVCHQKIQDALFPKQDAYTFMSIEENIRHR